MGGHKIDHQYSEKDFIRAFGKIIDIDWTAAPHCYTTPNGDTGLYIFTFKNGFAMPAK